MPQFTPNVLCCSAVVRTLSCWMLTKMEQPEKYLNHSSPGEHIWDELGHAATYGMQNPSELRQALLNKLSEFPMERTKHLVASMPLHRLAIVSVRGRNMCETKPSLSHMENISMINASFREFRYISVSIRRRDVFLDIHDFNQIETKWKIALKPQ